MNRTLRLAIAEDEGDVRDYLREMLVRQGHQVVVSAGNGRALVEQCLTARPDLVVADVRMPEMDGIQAARLLNEQRPTPVIFLSGHQGPELVEASSADYTMGYLVKPISEANVKTSIAVALKRFERFQALHHEADELRHALEDRKLIERAKGVVMKRLQTNEEEAFRRLRKRASDQNIKLVEVSRQVVAAEEIFHQLERS